MEGVTEQIMSKNEHEFVTKMSLEHTEFKLQTTKINCEKL